MKHPSWHPSTGGIVFAALACHISSWRSTTVSAFTSGHGGFPTKPRTLSKPSSIIILFDYADDSSPSDYDTGDLSPDVKEVMVDEKEEDEVIRDALKRELLLLASVTNRGAYATKDEQDIVIDLVAQLEALNPTIEPAGHCQGDWDLCYSNTQFFRSSPFFQSIRVAVGEENKGLAENGFDLHDQATVGSRVGRVRQSITSNKLVSEVDLEVGMLPGIPLSKATGTVVTSASLEVTGPSQWELQVETTKVKGSNVPLISMFTDELQFELPVGSFYSTVQGNVPLIPMTVRTLLDYTRGLV
jgi:PAP_fibrillin